MSERIVLGRKEYDAKDLASGAVVSFGENLPIGQRTGKIYPKYYVSIPSKGGWHVADEQTGEILSDGPVIGYSEDNLTPEEKKRSVVSPTSCPVCGTWFINPFSLSDHTEQVHGQMYESLKEAHREAEEAAVQKELAAKVSVPPVDVIEQNPGVHTIPWVVKKAPIAA